MPATDPLHDPSDFDASLGPRSASYGPGHNKGAWAVAFLLGILFIAAGLLKLSNMGPIRQMFEGWGFEPWFMVVVGVLEVAMGILVLVPRVATYASGFLVIEMLGALVTHVLHAEWAFALLTAALGALSMYLMWARIPDAGGATGHPHATGERV